MAVDMFLKLGDIKGESGDSKHKDEIDVLAWSWGASQSGTMHLGGGGGSGKVSVNDLSVTKYFDNASNSLFLKCCNGEHIPEGKLVVRKAGKDPLEYITITMKKVIITSYATGGSGAEDRLTENISLNFAEFKVEYKKQTDTGGGEAGPEVAWNIVKNEAA
ncbi:MAG: type VI secretion system tube protein Hcp [Comamonadaceae bacterium]|nr:MAG: type VI secretion system tube protein Hcp [Comamonadaceae bacterium]